MELSPITVSNTHDQLQLDETAILKLAILVCKAEGFDIEDLSIVLADHETVRELNKSYLSHDYNTDVLSFPLNEPGDGSVDGEVYIDLDTAKERCSEFGASFESESYRYIIHGLLHLMGYEDHTSDLKQVMRDKENTYLTQLEDL